MGNTNVSQEQIELGTCSTSSHTGNNSCDQAWDMYVINSWKKNLLAAESLQPCKSNIFGHKQGLLEDEHV